MSNYKPPYTITSKMLSLATKSVILHPESIIRDNKERYYRALEEAGSLGESTLFIEVILETIKSSVKSSDKSSVNTEDKIKRVGSARKGHWEINYA